MPETLGPLLERLIDSLPGGGEKRTGQRQMAGAVAEAIARRRHLIVAAGTGTGKSLAYLVPALASGSRVVVATATKALQDQLAQRDLPFVSGHLRRPVVFTVLKGRSNYLCRQRIHEIGGSSAGDQLRLDGTEEAAGGGRFGRDIRRLLAWATTARSGDRADLPWEPDPAAWSQVSVSAMDCPGANKCPSGRDCFAEEARRQAEVADVVVVNTHLYAAHLASGRTLLPDHDVVVFDEAHEVEDIASAGLGFSLTGGRFRALARTARSALTDAGDATDVDDGGRLLDEALGRHLGTRLDAPLDQALADTLTMLRERVTRLAQAVRSGDGEAARKARVAQSTGHLTGDIDAVIGLSDSQVAWVEGYADTPVLQVAPLDVGELLANLLWRTEDAPTAVFTSATIPLRLGERLGLGPDTYDQAAVDSPFDYQDQSLLYCPLHLPDPRQPTYEAAMHAELATLIEAAGGRTLALFTSWRAMQAAATELRQRTSFPIMTQSDLPKPALVERFRQEEASCLFATMGFWQGVDVPGPSLSLVTIDRIPFPRPDEPLLRARRDRLGPGAFGQIDLPRAATLLAQGAGRLIRARTDRGVVAVLDSRLGRARYRWDLVGALPPMRRTRHQDEVVEFLTRLRQAEPELVEDREPAPAKSQ